MFPFTPHTTPRLDFGLGGFLLNVYFYTVKAKKLSSLPKLRFSVRRIGQAGRYFRIPLPWKMTMSHKSSAKLRTCLLRSQLGTFSSPPVFQSHPCNKM